MTGSLNFSKFSSLIRKVEKRAYRLVKYHSQIISRSKWLRGKFKTLFHRSLGGGGGGGGGGEILGAEIASLGILWLDELESDFPAYHSCLASLGNKEVGGGGGGLSVSSFQYLVPLFPPLLWWWYPPLCTFSVLQNITQWSPPPWKFVETGKWFRPVNDSDR